MLLKNKINKMVVVWIIVIVTGTCLTIYGTHELSRELSKKDLTRQSHIIPDTFLIDFEIDAEIENKLKDDILAKCMSKIYGQRPDDTLGLSPFFDEIGYKSNQILEKNYSLGGEIYKIFKKIEVFGLATAKDSSIILDLQTAERVVELSSNTENKQSHIEVRNYNPKTNIFKIYYRNIKLDVNSKTISTFVTDLDEGKIKLTAIPSKEIEIVSLSNIYLKTKMLKYFKVENIKESNSQNIGKLKLILQ